MSLELSCWIAYFVLGGAIFYIRRKTKNQAVLDFSLIALFILMIVFIGIYIFAYRTQPMF